MSTVLAVDDEPQILRALRTSLAAHGHEVRVAASGGEGLSAVAAGGIDLVILDLGLPDVDGVQVIRELRTWSRVPIIVLSVRESQRDKVAALDAGADDYLAKPFGMDELLARVRATLRRSADRASAPPVLRFGELTIDLPRQLVRRGAAPVHLTRTEFALLREMATHPGTLLTHAWLLGRVWGPGYRDESQYLRVYVRQLRRKLGDEAATPRLIATEPGIGYRWIPDPE